MHRPARTEVCELGTITMSKNSHSPAALNKTQSSIVSSGSEDATCTEQQFTKSKRIVRNDCGKFFVRLSLRRRRLKDIQKAEKEGVEKFLFIWIGHHRDDTIHIYQNTSNGRNLVFARCLPTSNLPQKDLYVRFRYIKHLVPSHLIDRSLVGLY